VHKIEKKKLGDECGSPIFNKHNQLHQASQVVEETLVCISFKCGVKLKGPNSKGAFPCFVTLEDFASTALTREFE
jgi:hypothetical protein